MQDPVTAPDPSVVKAVQDAQTPQDAQAAIRMVQAAQDEDDIKAALERMFGKTPWYRSKKLWISILTSALPLVIQVMTGAVSWPVAVGIAGAAGVSYILSQAGVDKATATAAGQASQTYISAKLAKK